MYISSDTNVWVDFQAIDRLHHPFLLDHEYFISDLTLHDEVLQPPTMEEVLQKNGLKVVSPSEEELQFISVLASMYPRISGYDALALAIAKKRGWVLLSGDKALRIAAEAENVVCRGTIWVYDELLRCDRISKDDYVGAMTDLLKAVDRGITRLPRKELENRLNR